MAEGNKNKHEWKSLGTGPLEPDLNKREWAAVRRRYEWSESYEEGIAPKDEELELELFGEENHVLTGHNFSKYEEIKVTVKGSDIRPVESFEEANLHPQMKENVALARYEKPTPVQKWSIPMITEGHDLMACAQTGSGKTAAFLVPILSRLFGKAKKLAAPRPPPGKTRGYKAQPLVLILAPTRELATQIFDECRRFTVVYGGADAGPQRLELFKGCDILTATPGRLCDFVERGIISLSRVRYLVIDEADRMLDMGFEDDVRKIVSKSDMDDVARQTLMFSATFPNRIRTLAKDFLQDKHLFLTVGRIGGTTSDITQKIIFCEETDKRNTLVQLLLTQPPSRTLIFVETKRGADSLDAFLYNQHFPTTSIHGDRTQREREDALIAFKNGRSPILIATAVAARGLDIKNVMHVINYDLCSDIDEYVHRIGRTARVGNQGLATTFYNNSNEAIARDLVRLLLECEQEIPDFFKQYADITSYSNHGQQPTTASWDNSNTNNNNTQSQNSWSTPATNNNNSSQLQTPQQPANQTQDSWSGGPPSSAPSNNFSMPGQNWSSSPQQPNNTNNNTNTYQQNYQTQVPTSYQPPPPPVPQQHPPSNSQSQYSSQSQPPQTQHPQFQQYNQTAPQQPQYQNTPPQYQNAPPQYPQQSSSQSMPSQPQYGGGPMPGGGYNNNNGQPQENHNNNYNANGNNSSYSNGESKVRMGSPSKKGNNNSSSSPNRTTRSKSPKHHRNRSQNRLEAS
ncbi:8875_t:CDS:10 [Ambispora gerdemannii]|uniref:RNA helicase n=1 Tax=Ambispora gerdemannii TaxID=144530 RepID=A0A9N8YSG7_9GLOM|nr:8875_t:CDS:10 [Ambispora gerdemannii]